MTRHADAIAKALTSTRRQIDGNALGHAIICDEHNAICLPVSAGVIIGCPTACKEGLLSPGWEQQHHNREPAVSV